MNTNSGSSENVPHGKEDMESSVTEKSVTEKSVAAPSPALIYATLFAVQVAYVAWFFLAKLAMAKVNLPPLVFATYREVLATLSLLVILKWSIRDTNVTMFLVAKQMQPKAKSFFLLGFLMFCNVVGFIVGLSMVTSFTAAILQPTQPVFASIIAWACRSESMTPLKVLSIAMACSGAALTVYMGFIGDESQENQVADLVLDQLDNTTDVDHVVSSLSSAIDTNSNTKLGTALLIFQCAMGGAMYVVQKPLLSQGFSPLVVTTGSYTIASILTVSITVMKRGIMDPLLYVTSPLAWGVIVYASLAATVFTYLAMTWANKWASTSTVTLSLSLLPLLTALATAIGGGPALIPPQLLSCGLIIAGLCLKVYDQESVTFASNETPRKNVELTSVREQVKPFL